jgi:anti-sigma regulatory factor (Ser/Thr protein kinase)
MAAPRRGYRHKSRVTIDQEGVGVTGKEDQGPASFAVHLPYDETAVAMARSLLRGLLARYAVQDELMSDATLVLHELVVNGLVHGDPDEHDQIAVSAHIADGHLVISVLDRGDRGTVAAQPFTEDLTHGRGLAMVAVLSDSWAVDRSAGTRVSAQLSI